MASSEVPADVTENGVTILTHVVPPFTPPSGKSPEESDPGTEYGFLRESKVLGTVQIMIGTLTYLFGIVSTTYFQSVSGYSQVHRWGSMIYISSGALSVGMANQPHPYLIRYSLVMNVISAVVSGIAVLLLSLDMNIALNSSTYQGPFWDLSRSISGVLLVFSVLEIIISVCSSLFICRPTCCTDTMLVLRMASGFVSNSNKKSGFTAMTQVFPGGPGQTGVSTPGPFQKHLKRENKALGTVQIGIGIMTLLFGIVSTVHLKAPFVYSYVTLWGPAVFVISGVLSAVAGIKAHRSLVTVSLVMNVISSVIAGGSIILLSTSLILFHSEYLCHDISYREPYRHDTKQECKSLQELTYGLTGVLLILAVLEFLISICSSVFICRSSRRPEVPVYRHNNSQTKYSHKRQWRVLVQMRYI